MDVKHVDCDSKILERHSALIFEVFKLIIEVPFKYLKVVRVFVTKKFQDQR